MVFSLFCILVGRPMGGPIAPPPGYATARKPKHQVPLVIWDSAVNFFTEPYVYWPYLFVSCFVNLEARLKSQNPAGEKCLTTTMVLVLHSGIEIIKIFRWQRGQEGQVILFTTTLIAWTGSNQFANQWTTLLRRWLMCYYFPLRLIDKELHSGFLCLMASNQLLMERSQKVKMKTP